MAKHLLITTDDFGMCHAVNAGIHQAITGGVVTATNFLVAAPWFDEAMELAKQGGYNVGVHLNLTCDWDRLKWGPLTGAKSLSDRNGHFLPRYEALEAQAKDEDILNEYRAQLDRVKAAGWEPSHVDSHMLGATMLEPFHQRVKGLIARICEEYGLIYTYETREGKFVHFRDEQYISQRTQEEVFGVLDAWREDGIYHLISHAAVESDELENLCSPGHPARDWAAKIRLQDAAIVNDPATRQRIEDGGFELINLDGLKKLKASGG